MKLLLCCLLCWLPFAVIAQDDYYQPRPKPAPANNRPFTITLRDGTLLRGKIVRQDSVEAVIQTVNLGEIRVPAGQIVSMTQVSKSGDGETYPNLFSQTMRFTPTAFSAEKGRLYYRNYFVYFNQFEYGINDNWSVGTTFFTFGPTNLFSLNTKVSFPVSQKVRLGLNAQYAAVRFNNLLFSNNVYADVGYLQGVVTTGDRQINNTYGLGWSISNGDLSKSFVGTFGLVRKVSPKLTFITENMVLIGGRNDEFATMLSAGIRFDRKRHAFDLAAYIPLVFERNGKVYGTFIPFGSYHLRIGK